MQYKARGFMKENINDLKKFSQNNRLIRKIISNTAIILLILYLIIIAVGSVILDIKFDELVIMDIISAVILYFILRKVLFFRLIKDFKKLNNNLLEISKESIEFISNNQKTRLNRNNIRDIYSLPNTLFIVKEGYYRNEKKRTVYFVSAIPKSTFNSDEEYNTFFSSLEKDKLKELS
ncbi:hypothetical protein DIC82_16590 [Clostridium beijerinckii]|nr:hypothetical protein DIC82_16590 [Clostridium beijerinckii]